MTKSTQLNIWYDEKEELWVGNVIIGIEPFFGGDKGQITFICSSLSEDEVRLNLGLWLTRNTDFYV